MLPVALGLGSGLCIGVSDFLAGLTSRRLPALTVAWWSQLAGGVLIACALLVTGGRADPAAVAWGIGAGLGSGVGLACFYRGMAVGAISLVAPVSACGVLVPVLVALASGEWPSPRAGGGLLAMLGGIALVTMEPVEADPHRRDRTALVLALGAALGFGLFLVLIDRGATGEGAALWTVAGARLGSLTALVGLIAAGPRSVARPGRHLGVIVVLGVLDQSATALFGFAATQGNLGVVAVLASLYPVVTALLGRVVLAERLAPAQTVGVVLALIGVALVAA